jgi:hypothetical protein
MGAVPLLVAFVPPGDCAEVTVFVDGGNGLFGQYLGWM